MQYKCTRINKVKVQMFFQPQICDGPCLSSSSFSCVCVSFHRVIASMKDLIENHCLQLSALSSKIPFLFPLFLL